jgi:predicted RNA-binding Zn-ribbon protein involved in translation (DUF1610 family)
MINVREDWKSLLVWVIAGAGAGASLAGVFFPFHGLDWYLRDLPPPAALLSGACAGLVLGMWWNRKKPPLNRYPACATCGYNLTGNTSGTCPECGTPARLGEVHDGRARSRVFLCVCGISALLSAGLLIGWALSHQGFGYDDDHMFGPSVGVTGMARIGIHDIDLGAVWLTNQDWPYMGSVIAFSDEQGNTYPPTQIIGWNFPFYFRHIRQPGLTWWTAIFPLPLLLLLTGLAPSLWILHQRRVRRCSTGS